MTSEDMLLTFWPKLREDVETVTYWLLDDGWASPDILAAARRVRRFLREVDDPESCKVNEWPA